MIVCRKISVVTNMKGSREQGLGFRGTEKWGESGGVEEDIGHFFGKLTKTLKQFFVS